MTSQDYKLCTRCGYEKGAGHFYLMSTGRLGSYCKPCGASYAAEWNRANRERTRARQAAYYAANRERVRASHAAWRLANREWQRSYFAAYYKAHPEKAAHYVATRRARKTGNGGYHTLTEWLDKCALLGNLCIYCGKAAPLTRDHKVPLAMGGTDDIANIVPACQSCNSKKGTMDAAEYLQAAA